MKDTLTKNERYRLSMQYEVARLIAKDLHHESHSHPLTLLQTAEDCERLAKAIRIIIGA